MTQELYIPVRAKLSKFPEQGWQIYPTRTLRQLTGYKAQPYHSQFSRYGGNKAQQLTATGYFYVTKQGSRWWLVDPEGYLFMHVAVNAVTPHKSSTALPFFEQKFGTDQVWAETTARLLKTHHFNGLGAWSNWKLLRDTNQPSVYTTTWNFMADFGHSRGLTVQETGHYGYPNGCMPVFHPEFESFCDRYARTLLTTSSDPYLLGHFSDNELPGYADLLDRHLGLDSRHPDLRSGYEAAQNWLAQRKGKDPKEIEFSDITDLDRHDFLGYVFDRYFKVTSQAIRKYDPNHLLLGSRFYGYEKTCLQVLAAAGKYLDVISLNYYLAWTPDPNLLNNWADWSGCPLMITEWYAKGEDSGMANNTGAGWTVSTQAERGQFYQNFTLSLLENPNCVGWHWFMYQDNDPADTNTDPSNRNSNKGIVSIRYDEYRPLLEYMRELNFQVYSLVDYFDKPNVVKAL
jgi:hypothetical protein